MTLAEYLTYAASATSDFPYYLVCTNFAGNRGALLDDYSPPERLAVDALDLPGTTSHPHFFVGGGRTGSLLHVDPRATCGWNACVFGRKHWLLLPPHR